MKSSPVKGWKDILVLGDERLYQHCDPVTKEELPFVHDWVRQLDEVMQDVRRTFQFGRGIAAPQIGIMKRLFYINIDQPLVFINPEYTEKSDEQFELWDDCMSFPNLLVKVKRHKSVTVKYLDLDWEYQEFSAMDDMAELIQHEEDHLNGILCIDRAVNDRSFRWRR